MIKSKKVSLVIPSFNEKKRILDVVNVAKQVPQISEIIIVDDGSDLVSKNILKKITGIKLIVHPQNFGKTTALKTGVIHAAGDIIIFLDADLVGLQPHHIRQLLKPVLSNQADITLSQRDRHHWKIFDEGFIVAYTGDRCLNKELLVDNIDIFEAPGYLFEAAFNQRFFNSDLSIARVRFTGVSHFSKQEKDGIFLGLIKDIQMVWKILRFLRLKKLLFQTSHSRNLPLSS